MFRPDMSTFKGLSAPQYRQNVAKSSYLITLNAVRRQEDEYDDTG